MSQPTKIRIIAGRWRGRKLEVLARDGLRPTTDRVRETVFNWLQPFVFGARCLDLFAGTGALAFESVSRGASEALLVEVDTQSAKSISSIITKLEAENCSLLVGDYHNSKLLSQAGAFDVVFLDPPFKQGLLSPACQYLLDNSLLHAESLVYTEVESSLSEVPVPRSWRLYRQLKTKHSNCCLWRVSDCF